MTYRFTKRGACQQCDGLGYLPTFKHIDGGVCYACKGSGGGKVVGDGLYNAYAKSVFLGRVRKEQKYEKKKDALKRVVWRAWSVVTKKELTDAFDTRDAAAYVLERLIKEKNAKV
ncbi:MAG: hypothetical protein CMK74_14705 [Pseudomonadales bacterium]|nr:hypothetical protein [Pseudomonadales bacterium]